MKKTIGKMTELEMREHKVPWPKTRKKLMEFIDELLDKEHDYGTCVYAASMASVAMFYYMSHKLGMTGFQAGCAEMDFLKRTRNIERFRIVDYNNLLYPQYKNSEHFPEYMDYVNNNKEWLIDRAKENLKKSPDAHKSVIKHWEWLVSLQDSK